MTGDDEERRALIGLAYRMLGSIADAEDVVQESLLRWHRHMNPSEVQSVHAWLRQVTMNLCLDRLKSARAKREVYVGPWLPDPVLDATDLPPGADARSELASDLSFALLLTLERLSPLERAAFILHDVFDAGWSEVAETLGRSEVACRQLASRARERVREERPRFHPSTQQRERVLAAFGVAVSTGDHAALAQMLADEVVFTSDGGGHVKAALKPVSGRDRVARLLIGLRNKAMADGGEMSFTPASINGLPGFIVRRPTRNETIALDVDEAGVVHAIYVVSNPTKLRHLPGMS